MKKLFIFLLATILLVTPAFAAETAGSGLVTVSEMTSKTDKSGQHIVTAKIYNGTGESTRAGFAAYGMDESGKILEINSNDKFMSKGASETFTIILKNKAIKSVDGLAIDGSSRNGVQLLNYGSYVTGAGDTIVTGVVLNGTHDAGRIGFAAYGLDDKGNIVEVNSQDKFVSKGESRTFTLSLKSKATKRVEGLAIDGISLNGVELLKHGSYTTGAGSTIVTGVVLNGTNEAKRIGFAAYGLDDKGQVVETLSADKFVSKGESATFTVTLKSKANKKVEGLAIDGGSQDGVQLLKYGSYQTGTGETIVTGVVLNGTDEAIRIGFAAYGQDGQGKLIEANSADRFVSKGESQTFTVILKSKLSKKIAGLAIDGGSRDGVQLIKYGSYVNAAGETVVTGVVLNGTNEATRVGFAAYGKDTKGKVVEASSADRFVSKGESRTFTVILKGITNKKIEAIVMDGSSLTGVQLLKHGSYTNGAGETVVTGVIFNGTNEAKSVVFKASGHNAKGKAVETKSASKFVSKGESAAFTITLKDKTITKVTASGN
ncbi:hypothetical protein [Paenibacillus plantiphilus]|uniref:hypothetical protein n=1 Tax=Paenibacillus plantiphilus TaxID=2905650 RepID=UPI001F31FD88|nr:hypothetical protein [Paenibacillus plantiphilus]